VTMGMIVLGVMVLGWISLSRLPLEYLPSFSSHSISIEAPYPSSSPEEIERLLVQPLEDVMGTINGIEQLSARASASSASIEMLCEEKLGRYSSGNRLSEIQPSTITPSTIIPMVTRRSTAKTTHEASPEAASSRSFARSSINCSLKRCPVPTTPSD
jgi:Cu/Ag efflux pump CusA